MEAIGRILVPEQDSLSSGTLILARLRRGGGAEALVTEIQRGELLGGGDRALGFLFSLLLDAGARDENPPAGGLWMNHPGPARGDDH